jgi:peptidoglycan/LPS O-acetylase OafA/YrhL
MPQVTALPKHTSAVGRIDAIDITKGALVVLMVVYHCLNYSTQYNLPFRYLFFLPPSFILISGFLLSHVYLARSRTIDWRLTRRLFVRGTKLFVLFAALNIIAQFVRSQNYHRPALGLRGFIAEWEEVFVWGGSHVAAFDILLPIAYLLLFAPLLLWVRRAQRWALAALTVALLGLCAWLDRTGGCPPNIGLITAGVVGMLIGQLPNSAMSAAAGLLPVTVPAYVLHFWIGMKLGQPFLHQMIGAVLAVMIIYGFGLLGGSKGWASRRLIVLGQYSLVAYIGQIGLFQIYTHVLGRPEPSSGALVAMFATVLVLTAATVEFADWGQTRSKIFQAFYRSVVP